MPSLRTEVIRIATIRAGTREFSAAQLRDASRFIEGLPPGVRVNVDEWLHERWRFVFGETRELALRALAGWTPGSTFRVRPVSILLS